MKSLIPKTNNEKNIDNYLNKIRYSGFYKCFDLKTTCIDQKCTFDLLQINASIITKYCNDKKVKSFCIKDFFQYEYSKKIIASKTTFIGKANIKLETLSEFDKLFGQIYEMLSYTEILKKSKNGRSRYFEVLNFDILNVLMNDENACVYFICKHVLRLLEKEENFNNIIQNIVSTPNQEQKKQLLTEIRDWINISSNKFHNNDLEQISLKLINPIYYIYEFKKYNSNKHNRDFPQQIHDLKYIRMHPRYKSKSFGITQKEHKEVINNDTKEKNTEVTNKKLVKKWNNEWFKYKKVISYSVEYCSEISEKTISNPDIHHILKKNYFTKEKNYLKHSVENLILIDPGNEHRKIHGQDNKKYILYTFQEVLPKQYLKIINYTKNSIGKYDIYKFYDLMCYVIQEFLSEDHYNESDKCTPEICSSKIGELLDYCNAALNGQNKI